ncbi:MAG: DUF4829 domain-containing protein [Firmicutes bacterium]|nr:DUF4829 domain-containing protein [Bacillota bacterium]
MLKKVICCVLLIVILLAGCSATNTKDVSELEPNQLVQTYYESLANKDYIAAKSCLDEDYASEIMDLDDSYFNNLKSLKQITISEPSETQYGDNYQVVQIIAEYNATYKKIITSHDGNQYRFVNVAKKSQTSAWRIISIGTGP